MNLAELNELWKERHPETRDALLAIAEQQTNLRNEEAVLRRVKLDQLRALSKEVSDGAQVQDVR